eukprot:1539822-Pleurochrysis_carterae.AAC.5
MFDSVNATRRRSRSDHGAGSSRTITAKSALGVAALEVRATANSAAQECVPSSREQRSASPGEACCGASLSRDLQNGRVPGSTLWSTVVLGLGSSTRARVRRHRTVPMSDSREFRQARLMDRCAKNSDDASRSPVEAAARKTAASRSAELSGESTGARS